MRFANTFRGKYGVILHNGLSIYDLNTYFNWLSFSLMPDLLLQKGGVTN